MDINVTSMKSFVLFSSSSSKAFHIVLKFSFHDTTENNNITTYTGIDEIVSDFTVYSFWHLSSVYILYISINFLDPYSLEKRSFSCVFLGIKNSWPTIHTNTSIWLLPFSVNKCYRDIGFAVVALELNWLNQYLNACNAKNSSSKSNKFVD